MTTEPFTQMFDLAPKVKQRPRMTRRGRVFTPEATTIAENALRSLYEGPMFEGPVHLDVSFSNDWTEITVTPVAKPLMSGKLRGDVDNYLKLVMDGLQEQSGNPDVGAFRNDRQVVGFTVRKL